MKPFSFLLTLALMFISGFAWPGLTDADIPTVVMGQGSLQLVEPSPSPRVTAVSAVAVDVATGTVLFEKEPDHRAAPASTVKLMTALLVVETSSLDTVAVVRPEDLVGGSTMGLAPGQRVRVIDLLYGLLLPSGNDAAMVLARTVGATLAAPNEDPLEAFVRLMNQEAGRIGMASTHFANPHGLDHPDQYTTARDLATLARYVLRFPLIRKITSTEEYTWNANPPRLLRNTNELLRTYPGADGMKTGTTELAGECLVATVTRDGRTTLLVLLGSTDRYADARTVFDQLIPYYLLLDVGEVLGEVNYPPVALPQGRENEQILIPRWERPYLRALNYLWQGDRVWSDLWLADSLVMSLSLASPPQ